MSVWWRKTAKLRVLHPFWIRESKFGITLIYQIVSGKYSRKLLYSLHAVILALLRNGAGVLTFLLHPAQGEDGG